MLKRQNGGDRTVPEQQVIKRKHKRQLIQNNTKFGGSAVSMCGGAPCEAAGGSRKAAPAVRPTEKQREAKLPTGWLGSLHWTLVGGAAKANIGPLSAHYSTWNIFLMLRKASGPRVSDKMTISIHLDEMQKTDGARAKKLLKQLPGGGLGQSCSIKHPHAPPRCGMDREIRHGWKRAVHNESVRIYRSKKKVPAGDLDGSVKPADQEKMERKLILSL
ncbi:hypothetical protein SELMODRAFT_408339 [Selaginella moellendorffii]|uniref:Uncharacterized protein n=1 Tax=Selaginella moellendorffii TaxID=88036 RepID=D8R7Z4_SELML|nr:hypothetical protein SELMODRAFT_408339 [Selaginella moellendorffii]